VRVSVCVAASAMHFFAQDVFINLYLSAIVTKNGDTASEILVSSGAVHTHVSYFYSIYLPSNQRNWAKKMWGEGNEGGEEALMKIVLARHNWTKEKASIALAKVLLGREGDGTMEGGWGGQILW